MGHPEFRPDSHPAGGSGDAAPSRLSGTIRFVSRTQTELVTSATPSPDDPILARAADILLRGGLVAFPTETVYGLGADASNESAVRRIFEAKGRPADNPLIVHVEDEAAARALAAEWPQAAGRLAAAFWPGPLTLVVWKLPVVPDAVTGGGPTVALRVPAHPVARALLRATGRPLAAPSANRSSRLSPTTAEHVLRDLAGRIDLVLDGGPTAGGIESTVLDVTVAPPLVLRPGPIAPRALEAVVGPVRVPEHGSQAGELAEANVGESSPGRAALRSPGRAALRSPGLLSRHYAPRARLELIARGDSVRLRELAAGGARVGWLGFAGAAPATCAGPEAARITRVELPAGADAYAARLYAALHALDAAGVDVILVERPPDGEEWLAVRDRLRRAAAT